MSSKDSSRSIDVAIAASPLLGGLCMRIPEVLQREVLPKLTARDRLSFAMVAPLPFRLVSQSGLLVAPGPEGTPDLILRMALDPPRRAMILLMAMNRGQLWVDDLHSKLSSKLSSHVGLDVETGRPYCVRCRRTEGQNYGRTKLRSIRALYDHAQVLGVFDGKKQSRRWHREMASRLGAFLEFFE